MAECISFQEIQEMKPEKISTLDTKMRQALTLRYPVGPAPIWQLYMTLRPPKVSRLSRSVNIMLRSLETCASMLQARREQCSRTNVLFRGPWGSFSSPPQRCLGGWRR